jgi:uncharacterized protein (DUF2062 family)
MLSFFQRRIAAPVKTLLLQNVTPEKIALSLACGVVLGLFPVIGSTTLLCMMAAFVLRLNLPAVQAANYLVYPVQLALILPFMRAGEFLFRADRTPLTLKQMAAAVHQNAWQAFHLLWRLEVHGVAAWLLFAPVAIAVLYRMFLFMALRLAKTLQWSDRPIDA